MGSHLVVKVTQPHVEQLHKYIDQVMVELGRLRREAESTDSQGRLKRIDEVSYLVDTIRQDLPPKRLKILL